MLVSKCCNAKISVVMTPDFPGDDVATMTVGTCHFECRKCGEACDIKEE